VRRGFTVLELLVASLLLSMLVTALTMIFNQSSIAWRTGTAGVVNLQNTRREMGQVNADRDAYLPSVEGEGDLKWRIVSVFNDDGSLRADRAVIEGTPYKFTYGKAQKGEKIDISGKDKGQSSSLCSVGVRSAGPDRVFGTEDDVTTWPEGLQ